MRLEGGHGGRAPPEVAEAWGRRPGGRRPRIPKKNPAPALSGQNRAPLKPTTTLQANRNGPLRATVEVARCPAASGIGAEDRVLIVCTRETDLSQLTERSKHTDAWSFVTHSSP